MEKKSIGVRYRKLRDDSFSWSLFDVAQLILISELTIGRGLSLRHPSINKVSSSETSVFAYHGDNLAEATNASGTAVAGCRLLRDGKRAHRPDFAIPR